MRAFALLFSVLLLPACQLDDPAEVTRFAEEWFEVEEVKHHDSKARCSATVLRMASAELHASVYPVAGAEQAVFMMSHGMPVVLQVDGRSPHELSTAIMSAELARGVGIVNTVTGAEPCMSDVVAAGTSELINTPGAVTIYDPERLALIFADPQRRTAVYLRVKP